MKKTFKELTVGDVFYRVYKDRTELMESTVEKVETNTLSYNYGDKLDRLDYHSVKDKTHYYFTSKEDAVRYCKAQTVKELIGMIKTAKGYIERVRQYKLDN